eukprot:905139-Rhodomonas_salina.1
MSQRLALPQPSRQMNHDLCTKPLFCFTNVVLVEAKMSQRLAVLKPPRQLICSLLSDGDVDNFKMGERLALHQHIPQLTLCRSTIERKILVQWLSHATEQVKTSQRLAFPQHLSQLAYSLLPKKGAREAKMNQRLAKRCCWRAPSNPCESLCRL